MNKRKLTFTFLPVILILFFGCDEDGGKNDRDRTILRKPVVIGDSLAAGVQSNGLVQSFQENSFAFFVSLQTGNRDEFEQPLIASPGVGIDPDFGTAPLTFEDGQIVVNDLNVDPVSLLINFSLPQAYNNLGIPGARLFDVGNTVSSADNVFFDFILRGMGTQLGQTISLNPSLVLLWIGNNDVLGAVTSGGNPDRITPEEDFTFEFGKLLMELLNNTSAQVVVANIPDVTEIPFCTFSSRFFRTIPALGINTPVPVLFDENTNPIDFGDGVFIPLLTQEFDVVHVLFPANFAYLAGIGIPDEEALIELGFSTTEAEFLVSEMIKAGLNPTGLPLDDNLTLTGLEKVNIQAAVEVFNLIISNLALDFNIPVVDINSAYKQLTTEGIENYTGTYVLEDPLNTAFSLDGIHPNNGGHAIIANLFIDVINESFGLDIPPLDTDQFRGQYSNTDSIEGITIDDMMTSDRHLFW